MWRKTATKKALFHKLSSSVRIGGRTSGTPEGKLWVGICKRSLTDEKAKGAGLERAFLLCWVAHIVVE